MSDEKLNKFMLLFYRAVCMIQKGLAEFLGIDKNCDIK
jgi:hypothetical protein